MRIPLTPSSHMFPFKAPSKNNKCCFLLDFHSWNSPSPKHNYHKSSLLGILICIFGGAITPNNRSLSHNTFLSSIIVVLFHLIPFELITSMSNLQYCEFITLRVVRACLNMAIFLPNHIFQQRKLGLTIHTLLMSCLFTKLLRHFLCQIWSMSHQAKGIFIFLPNSSKELFHNYLVN
jgi:hypothetical protein